MTSALLKRLNGPRHKPRSVSSCVIVLGMGGAPAAGLHIYGLACACPKPGAALFLPVPGDVGDHALWLCRRDLAGLWILRPGFRGIEDRRWWNIALAIQFFPSRRTPSAAGPVSARAEPFRSAGSHEPAATWGAARRAALFYNTIGSFRWCSDVLHMFPPSEQGGRHALRLAPRALARGVTAALLACCCVLPGCRGCRPIVDGELDD